MFGYWKNRWCSAQDEIKELQATITGLEIERDGVYEQSKTLSAQVKAVHAQLTTVRQDKAELEVKNKQLEQELQRTVQVLAEEEARRKTLEQTISTFSEVKGKLLEECDSLNKEVMKLNSSIENYKDTILSIDGRREELEQEVNDLETGNKALRDSVLAWQDKYKSLHVTLENKDISIDKLNKKIDHIKAAVNILMDAIDGHAVVDTEILVTKGGKATYSEKNWEKTEEFPLT